MASGYEVDEKNEYSEEFVNEFLNSLGNLMLISGSHNASIGNKPFSDKLKSYNQNPLLNQQLEIKDYTNLSNDKVYWRREEIIKRHQKILNFALNNWSFDAV